MYLSVQYICALNVSESRGGVDVYLQTWKEIWLKLEFENTPMKDTNWGELDM